MGRRTTLRNVRVSDEVWEAASARASLEGVTLSEKIREWLAEYGGVDPDKGLVGGRKPKKNRPPY